MKHYIIIALLSFATVGAIRAEITQEDLGLIGENGLGGVYEGAMKEECMRACTSSTAIPKRTTEQCREYCGASSTTTGPN